MEQLRRKVPTPLLDLMQTFLLISRPAALCHGLFLVKDLAAAILRGLDTDDLVLE
jgi:hypothetical protein